MLEQIISKSFDIEFCAEIMTEEDYGTIPSSNSSHSHCKLLSAFSSSRDRIFSENICLISSEIKDLRNFARCLALEITRETRMYLNQK